MEDAGMRQGATGMEMEDGERSPTGGPEALARRRWQSAVEDNHIESIGRN